MADTTRGAGRLRAWPRKRGRGGTKVQKKNQQNFMNAQRATKYFAPQMYLWFMQQVEDSPLLPRDAMTMMLYNRLYAFTLDTGRTLWPMPAYQDVSQALDVITEDPGETIMRGENGWIPVEAPGPSSATKWKILKDVTITDPVDYVTCDEIANYNETLFMLHNVAAATTTNRVAQVSTDKGVTWFDTVDDYRYNAPEGTTAARAYMSLHNSNSANPITAIGSIMNLNGGMPAIGKSDTYDGKIWLFIGSEDPVNAIRIGNLNGTNLLSGRIIIMAR